MSNGVEVLTLIDVHVLTIIFIFQLSPESQVWGIFVFVCLLKIKLSEPIKEYN